MIGYKSKDTVVFLVTVRRQAGQALWKILLLYSVFTLLFLEQYLFFSDLKTSLFSLYKDCKAIWVRKQRNLAKIIVFTNKKKTVIYHGEIFV